MVGDEKPGAPDAPDGADGARQGEPDAGDERTAGGKVIQAEVFLSRLAERQEERGLAEGETRVVDAILGALESLGFDPDIVAPAFVRMTRGASPEDDATSDADAESPGLEDMAVEELFLSELHAGRSPSLDAYMRRHAAQRDALLRLAMRMDPDELAGGEAPEAITPEQESAVLAGQNEGTRRALRELAKRGGQRAQGGGRRVAEEKAPYNAGHPGGSPGDTPKERPARGRKRARPAQPEETRPEG